MTSTAKGRRHPRRRRIPAPRVILTSIQTPLPLRAVGLVVTREAPDSRRYHLKTDLVTLDPHETDQVTLDPHETDRITLDPHETNRVTRGNH